MTKINADYAYMYIIYHDHVHLIHFSPDICYKHTHILLGVIPIIAITLTLFAYVNTHTQDITYIHTYI